VFRNDFGRCPLDHTVLALLERDVLVGTTLAGRYMIERSVGEGGMGRVYRARHRNLDRLFAVKVLYGDLAADSKMRQRFEREARAASRLDHPHLVSVLDSGITDTGLLYLVMTYVEGRELGEVIEDEAPFATERVHRLARQLGQGLAHAHDLDLVHRDFKGQNVLVSGRGEDEHARILDFGLAFMREEPDSSRLTTEGVVMGTPAYMSPEQSTGQDLDHRTDLFSLGVLIYEMLAGKLPFDGSPLELARQNLAAIPPPIARRVPGLVVDPGLEGIAHRLMHKLPAERYQSAHEVLAVLDMIAAGDQDTHSVPALPAISAAVRPRPYTGRVAAGVNEAAAGMDATAVTHSMDQAATMVSLVVPPAVSPGARARTEQPAPARRPAQVPTERVHARPRQLRKLVALAAALGLVAMVMIGLLVRGGDRAAELAAGPGPTGPAPAEAPAPTPVEVAAPAEIVATAPDAAPAAEPAAPGPPRSPASRPPRSPRPGRNTAEPATTPATEPTGPVAGGKEPGGKEPGGKEPGGKEPGGKEPGGKEPGGKEPGGKEPGAAPSAASDLEALYKRVGQKLATFESERGASAARPLWDVYSAIPLLDAMRTPSMGQDAMRTLRRIERDIAAARPAPP
jgi:eukaryotic-like serine/threonine-protein kinase